MIGIKIHRFAEELWPINRSITGSGLRKTLRCIQNKLPSLAIHSIQSKSKVFDWEVPREWKVNSAYIIKPDGHKICDFSSNNLHLLNYSVPFKGDLTLQELKPNLYTLPEQPDAIPYVTSYYQERWGFCMTHSEYVSLPEGSYKVIVDTELFDGELNYGELFIPGKSKKEVLLSTYVCHPSMANNELSGPTVLTYIAKFIDDLPDREYSYRIIFIPETIGSIVYLSRNYKYLQKNTFAGFNLSCLGDDRAYSYLESRDGDTISDRVAKHVLKWIDPNFLTYDWLGRGGDERQFCAPGIDLPIASIMRTKYAEYPEYHTSLDDLKNVVTPDGLEGGFQAIQKCILTIENNKLYKTTTLCEPNLGKRGLYPTISTQTNDKSVRKLLDLISLCDGKTYLLEIAESMGVEILDLCGLVDQLREQGLLVEV